MEFGRDYIQLGQFNPHHQFCLPDNEYETSTVLRYGTSDFCEEAANELSAYLMQAGNNLYNSFIETLTNVSNGIQQFPENCEKAANDLGAYLKKTGINLSNSINHYATKILRPEEFELKVQTLESQLVTLLDSVTSIPDVNGVAETKKPIYNREKLGLILKNLEKDAGEIENNSVAKSRLAKIQAVLMENKSDFLNIEEWVYVSKMLNAISADWEKEAQAIYKDQRDKQTAYEDLLDSKALNLPFFRSNNLLMLCREDLVPVLVTVKEEIDPLLKEITEKLKKLKSNPKLDELDETDSVALRLASQLSKVSCNVLRNSRTLKGAWDSIAPALEEIEKIFGNLEKEVGANSKIKISERTRDAFKEVMRVIASKGIIEARSQAESASKKSQSQQRAIQMLEDVKLVSGLQIRWLAEAEITPALEKYNKETTQMGNSDATSHSVSAGISTPLSLLLPSKGAVVNYINEVTEYADDECYAAETKKHYGGAVAEGRIPLVVGKIAVKGTVLPFTGSYWECLTPKTCATTQFKSLIRKTKHREAPEIARYLSGNSILVTSKTMVGLSIPDKLKSDLLRFADADVVNGVLLGDEDEVAELDQLKEKYDALKESMDKRLSLYLPCKDAQEEIPSSAEPKKPHEHFPISSMQRELGIIPADVSGHMEKLNFTASLGLGDGLGDIKLGGVEGGDIFKLSITGSLEHNKQTLRVTKKTAPDEHFENPLREDRELTMWEAGLFDVDSWSLWFADKSDKPEGSMKEKDYIKQNVKVRFDVFKEAISTGWKKESYTGLGVQVLSMLRRSDEKKKGFVSKDDFIKFLTEKKLNENLRDNLIILKENRLSPVQISPKAEEKLTAEFWQEFANIEGHDFKFDEKDPVDLINCFTRLKQDLAEYTNLQARIAQSAAQGFKAPQEIETANIFAERYNASSSEQLLQRMVYANVYLLTNLMSLPEQDLNKFLNNQDLKDALKKAMPQLDTESIVNADQLKDAISQFNKTALLPFGKELLNPKFNVDKEKLKKLCCVHEIIDFVNTRKILTLSVELPTAIPFNPVRKFEAKFTDRRQGHTNILRAGDYFDVDLTLEGKVADMKAVAGGLTPYIYEWCTDKEFTKDILSYMTTALDMIGPVGTVSVKGTYKFRFARPDQFSEDSEKFSRSQYFKRSTFDTVIQVGAERIPVWAGPVDIIGGYMYTAATSELLKEKWGKNSVFYPFIFFMHENNTGKINKVTGKVSEDSIWKPENNKKSLKEVFINCANNYKRWPGFLYGEDGDIEIELKEMEKAIGRNKNFLKQLLINLENELKVSTDQILLPTLPDKIKAVKKMIKIDLDQNTLPKFPEILREFDFSYARKQFKGLASQFNKNQTDGNYAVAEQSFENVMRAFVPHWMERRANSKIVEMCPLPKVEDGSAVIAKRIKDREELAKRRLQDRKRQFLEAA